MTLTEKYGFKLICAIVCAILCGFQLKLVIIQYISCNVISEINVRFPTNDTPAVMVCVNLDIDEFAKVSLVSLDKISLMFDQIFINLNVTIGKLIMIMQSVLVVYQSISIVGQL